MNTQETREAVAKIVGETSPELAKEVMALTDKQIETMRQMFRDGTADKIREAA